MYNIYFVPTVYDYANEIIVLLMNLYIPFLCNGCMSHNYCCIIVKLVDDNFIDESTMMVFLLFF